MSRKQTIVVMAALCALSLMVYLTEVNVGEEVETLNAVRSPQAVFASCEAGVETKMTDTAKESIPTDTAKESISAVTPTSVQAPEEEFLIWMGWTMCESGEESWALTAGDGGHAYGRYQLDDRYSLAEFFRFCVNESPEDYGSFTTFYYVDGKGKAHIKNTERIAKEWSWICYLKEENFHEMQTKFAFEYYYENAKETLRQSGIETDRYGPVLHGTVMSLAIRNGFYKPNLSSLIDTYHKDIDEREWLSKIYAAETTKHPDQATRWEERQRDAAMAALTALEDKGITKDEAYEKYAIEAIQLF